MVVKLQDYKKTLLDSKKHRLIFESINYISPLNKDDWENFKIEAAAIIKSKPYAIFEIDEQNKKIAISHHTYPLEKI